MADYFIVWNEGRTEGFITDSLGDAKQTQSGRFRNPYTSAGEAFHECYSDDDLGLQSVEIEPIPQA